MAVLIQWLGLLLVMIGLGHWVWLLGGRPAAMRSLTWLWCGLGGLMLGFLLLQAAVYQDIPLKRTVPILLGVAGVGTGLLGIRCWRNRAGFSPARRKEMGWIMAAGLGAGLLHATSVMGVGPDRFLGEAQIDHVNYVATSQMLIDEPFSTQVSEIGLRPWLWRALELKNDRITECMAVGVAAVVSGQDAQRAWGGTALFFTVLLGLSLAGMWRVAAAMPSWAAFCLGLTGAMIPVVAKIYLMGFYSQLTSLMVFPALIAVCRPGALSPRVALGIATLLLAFLAGAYTEFWPIGLGVAGAAILGWRRRWYIRLLLAVTPLGSLLLTGYYMATMAGALIDRPSGVVSNPALLSGWVPGGITWQGWGENFFGGVGELGALFGALVVLGMLLGIGLQARHRMQHWVLGLAVPVMLVLFFLWLPQRPVYALYKLLAEFSPLCLGLAALGWVRALRWCGKPRLLPGLILTLAAFWVIGGSIHQHLQLVEKSSRDDGQRLKLFWLARERAEAAPGSDFFVESSNKLIGVWLAYFARSSNVYYGLPVISDRRVPSEAAPFRKIPADKSLTWLDLDRIGLVKDLEPSLNVDLVGVRDQFQQANGQVFILGGQTDIRVGRSVDAGREARGFVLEFGLMPLATACVVTLEDASGIVGEWLIDAPRLTSTRLWASVGSNLFRLRCRPVSDQGGSAASDQDLLLLQSLSIESIPSVENPERASAP